MNPAGKNPVARLTRWRHFQQELAVGALREGQRTTIEAANALRLTETSLEGLSRRKSSSASSGRIDLGLYGQLLLHEHAALAERERRATQLERCQDELKQLGSSAVAAKSRSKVAEARQARYAGIVRDREEKRVFDLTADQWLSARGRRT